MFEGVFEGVFIYVHIVFAFSVFAMYKYALGGVGMGKKYTLLCEYNAQTPQLLFHVCSVAYAFSLVLVLRNSLFGALTFIVWEPFLYIFLILLFLSYLR
jgi:hypothetical protein